MSSSVAAGVIEVGLVILVLLVMVIVAVGLVSVFLKVLTGSWLRQWIQRQFLSRWYPRD